MGKDLVAAVATAVVALGVAGSAKAGYYPPVATRTVVEKKVVVAQSKKVVIRDDGYVRFACGERFSGRRM